MKHYQDIDGLDAAIERIIRKKVENYYTDWKHYDRPKYMTLKGSNAVKDKKAILIARTCGTYIFTLDEIATYHFAATVYDYYYTQDSGDYYYIDLTTYGIEKIDAATFGKTLQKAA